MYWPNPGKENTNETVELAIKRAQELDINYLVVASNSGETAKKCLTPGLQVICVTHHVGFREPGLDEMPKPMRRELQEKGVSILTTTHLLAGADRALRFKFQGVYPAEIIADTLRLLGQGVKVGVEIAVMALDSGLIPYGEKVVAVGGSGGGADTALLITPDHSPYLFNTKIHEIICKPREF